MSVATIRLLRKALKRKKKLLPKVSKKQGKPGKKAKEKARRHKLKKNVSWDTRMSRRRTKKYRDRSWLKYRREQFENAEKGLGGTYKELAKRLRNYPTKKGNVIPLKYKKDFEETRKAIINDALMYGDKARKKGAGKQLKDNIRNSREYFKKQRGRKLLLKSLKARKRRK